MKYIHDLKDYESKSGRIQGFSKPLLVGLKGPTPIKVVGHVAFEEYKKEKVLPRALVKELKETFNEIRQKNPDRGAYIGRGFYVPGLAHPPGPRTAVIYNFNEYLNELEIFYKFVLDNDFDKEGSEISLILHPFIHPYVPPLCRDPEVAYPGGAVTPSRHNKNEVIIEALWGHDEAIQTLPHDTYIVDFIKHIIVEKKIQAKTHALKALHGHEYKKVSIPPSHQDIQVLNDFQILQLANNYKRLFEKFGPHRVEFIQQREGIIYRECQRFTFRPEQKFKINTKGEVFTVTEPPDLEEITTDINIISIHPKIIQDRNMDILTSVAVNSPHEMIILYPGTVTTAHAATIFREQGHTLIFVRNDLFKTGDYVEIGLSGNHIIAKKVKKPIYPKTITIEAINSESKHLVGAKAYRLYEIAQFDIEIPKSFVLTTDAFSEIIKTHKIEKYLSGLSIVQPLKDLKRKTVAFRKKFEAISITPSLKEVVLKSFREFNFEKVAIRSSATCEDSENASFAGQFSSYLNVDINNLFEGIKKCWLSTFSDSVIDYAYANQIPIGSIRMAVLIQEMIHADKAGVLFTKDVDKNDESKILIEATWGLGDCVVDGTANPVQIEVAKNDKKISYRNVSKKDKILSKKEVVNLFNVGLKIEKLYGKPQDIEWVIKNGKVKILQTRPITT